MSKKMELITVNDDKIDLFIERDAGNNIRILMGGKRKDCLKNWENLKSLCDQVINQLKDAEET